MASVSSCISGGVGGVGSEGGPAMVRVIGSHACRTLGLTRTSLPKWLSTYRLPSGPGRTPMGHPSITATSMREPPTTLSRAGGTSSAESVALPLSENQ